jgi:o-succinylbenzoate---CoA ligase
MERAELARLLGASPVTAPGAARTVIAEPDPRRFMAALATAAAGKGEVFLTDPAWREAEKAQLDSLLATPPPREMPAERGWLMIPTGGSSGRIKFARHDQDTVTAAVSGFTRHFGIRQVNALGLLPLHHVSGLMAWMRCALTGGEYLPASWKDLESGRWPELTERPEGWVLSLVPTQLERLLREPAAVERLRRFRCVFLGGAPAWPELLDRAAAARLPLSTGYGMTETAAMATGLRPGEFLAGNRNSGRPLPHARVRLAGDCRITIAGDSIMRGYWPDWDETHEFLTADLGELDLSGALTVLGRSDGVIITGGEKVRPEEVEAILRGTGQFADIAIVGEPDPEWGYRIVAAYPRDPAPDLELVRRTVEAKLAPYKRPKVYVPLAVWPRNPQGKLSRPQLMDAVLAGLRTGGAAGSD